MEMLPVLIGMGVGTGAGALGAGTLGAGLAGTGASMLASQFLPGRRPGPPALVGGTLPQVSSLQPFPSPSQGGASIPLGGQSVPAATRLGPMNQGMQGMDLAQLLLLLSQTQGGR